MQTRSTASSFLLRDGQVLLLHRPAGVRSFPDRWSAVSGKLEDGESALEAARREIEEETGYRPDSLRLLAAGSPFEAMEQQREICWRIHPFLWLLHDPGEPVLDDENDDHAWARLDALSKFETVPRLPEALDAMQPRLSRELLDGERWLIEDRSHGAHQLGSRMLDILEATLPTLMEWPQWVWGVMRLGASRPAMAPLAGLARRILRGQGPRELPEIAGPWAATLSARDRVEAAEAVIEAREALEDAVRRASEAGARTLAGQGLVATYSYSSTVLEAFRLAATRPNAPRQVLLSPVHPTDEGLAMERALRGLGYRLERVEDGVLGSRLAECDLLLLGADAVFPDASIANRAGSSSLAQAAHAAGVRVEVLADDFKWQARPEHFEAECVVTERGEEALFERVDAGYLDRILGFQAPSD